MGVDSMTNMSGDVSGDMSGGMSSAPLAGSSVQSGASTGVPEQAGAADSSCAVANPDTANPATNPENGNGDNTAEGNPAAPNAFQAEAYNFAMPAAVAQDPALVSRIQDFCASSQLSPQQAQAAMSFWQAEQNAAMEQGLKHCEQNLKDRWQGSYDHKLEQARSTLKMLDSRMEGRLMPLMQGPLGNSPVFAEMLEKLSDVVGESTMEAGGMGGTRGSFAGPQRMSTEDFLRQVVFK